MRHVKPQGHSSRARIVYPSVANLHREITRQGRSDVASRSLGQVEAYLTVREILPEASTVRPELTAEGGRRWLAMVRA